MPTSPDHLPRLDRAPTADCSALSSGSAILHSSSCRDAASRQSRAYVAIPSPISTRVRHAPPASSRASPSNAQPSPVTAEHADPPGRPLVLPPLLGQVHLAADTHVRHALGHPGRSRTARPATGPRAHPRRPPPPSARRTPSASTGSSLRAQPAPSTSTTRIPPISITPSTRSRVVPGSAADDRSLPSHQQVEQRRLARVRLGPGSPPERPLALSVPPRPVAANASISALTACRRASRSATTQLDLILDEVDRTFHQRPAGSTRADRIRRRRPERPPPPAAVALPRACQ